jgi:hypothetical protein
LWHVVLKTLLLKRIWDLPLQRKYETAVLD